MLWDLFTVFFKLGALTWGGGYAMLPALEHECVTKRGWLDKELFDDYLVISQTTPGPIATSMALLTGRHLAGLQGAAISIFAISLPSILLALAVSFFLLSRPLPEFVERMLYVLKPAVTGLIWAAALRLAVGLPRKWEIYIIAGLSLFLLLFTKVHPLLVLIGGGIALIFVRKKQGEQSVGS